MLRGIGKLATIGAVGSSFGMVNDRNEAVESARDKSLTTPIYANHDVGYMGYEEAYFPEKVYIKDGKYVDKHMWPGNLVGDIKSLKTNILAVDSLDFKPFQATDDFVDFRFWRVLPGNPFDMKTEDEPFYIIAADTDSGLLAQKKRDFLVIDPEDPAKDIALSGIIKHYESTIKGDVGDDLNLPVAENDLDLFHNKYLYETAVSNYGIGAGPLLYLIAKGAILNKTISRRELFRKGTVSVLGFLNAARLMWPLNTDANTYYNYLYSPISAIPDIVDKFNNTLKPAVFRNALIAAKLDDAEKEIDPLATLKKAAVMGSFHSFGKPVWNNARMRNDVIKNWFEGIFKTIQKTESEKPPEEVANYVAAYFSGVNIYEVGEQPQELTPEEVKKNIVLKKQLISPTITDLALEAAMSTGIIGNPLS